MRISSGPDSAARTTGRWLRWWLGAACGTALLAAAIYGCSHLTPYYREGHGLSAAWVNNDDITYRLLLIGDAGSPDPKGEPALQALATQVNQIPQRTTVVFLGDNIYERGMPEPAPTPDPAAEAAVKAADILVSDIFQTRKEAERIINAQIDVVRGNGAHAIFIPGNHDWDQSNSGGWKRMLALDAYLRAVHERDGLNVELQPPAGCPGPVAVPLANVAELLAIDTQWWLASDDSEEKPTLTRNPTGCPYVTEPAVSGALRDMLEHAAHDRRRAVVVGHHPLASHGPHGGFSEPWTHIFPLYPARYYVPVYLEWFPLPVVGSAVVGFRACCSPSVQDIPNGTNRHMRRDLLGAMEQAAADGAAPLAYVAGHDHGLQVIESDAGPQHLLVSGLGSSDRASVVGSAGNTLFAHANPDAPGFMQIDFLSDGRVRFAVLEYAGKQQPPVEMYSFFDKQE
jgi:hypothetical protein